MKRWKNAEDLQAAIDGYFEECRGTICTDFGGTPLRDKRGVPVREGAKPPTVTGLAVALGLGSRQALIDWQGRPEYAEIITAAKLRIEDYVEGRLFDREGFPGAKWALRTNYGWSDADTEERGPMPDAPHRSWGPPTDGS